MRAEGCSELTPSPLALFGALALLFLFPLRGPRQGGDPRFIWTIGFLFTLGAIASAFAALDSLARMSLGTCMLLSYARTWIRMDDHESLWLPRAVGIAAVLWPLLKLPQETLWIVLGLLCIQQLPQVVRVAQWPTWILLAGVLGVGTPTNIPFLIALGVALAGTTSWLAMSGAVLTVVGCSRFGRPEIAAAGAVLLAGVLVVRQTANEGLATSGKPRYTSVFSVRD